MIVPARTRRRIAHALIAVTSMVVAGVTPALAAGAPASAPTKTVKAVVVKSWGGCGSSSLIWDQLNANWSAYGSIPIAIDHSNQDLCGGSFTFAALKASGADVVILDDPAGKPYQYTAKEVSALKKYAAQGHGLVGTYLTFGFPSEGIDNSALAPLFGLSATAGWTGGDIAITPTYKLKKAGALGRNLPNPYVSAGYGYSQRPGDGVWSTNDLQGAKIVGLTSAKTAAITTYRAKTYDAVYIANMAEYEGGAEDLQFFYNAIIYPKNG